jgi:hypothetical protein
MESLWTHLKNLKTTRDAYLGQQLSMHIKNISIHLVTQSPQGTDKHCCSPGKKVDNIEMTKTH